MLPSLFKAIDTRCSIYRCAVEDQHRGTCDIPKCTYHGNSQDEDPVCTTLCTQKQPEITYTERELEACDTHLIEWSPCKIDLTQGDRRHCFKSRRSGYDTFEYVARLFFGRNPSGRPRPYLVSAMEDGFQRWSSVDEGAASYWGKLTRYGKCSVYDGESLLLSGIVTLAAVLREPNIGRKHPLKAVAMIT